MCLLASAAPPATIHAADPVTIFDLSAWGAISSFNQCTFTSYEYDRPSRVWSYSTGFPSYVVLYSYSVDDYDDYLITPEYQLQPGHQYILSVQPSQHSAYAGSRASVDVLMGQGADARNYDVLKEFRGFAYEASPSADKTENIPVTVDTEGQYRVAIHSLDAARIYNFKLLDYGSPTQPLAPTALEVTPDPSGAATATVSFVMPTQNIGGDNLSYNLSYKIYRLLLGSGDSEPMLVQNDNASAGQTVTWTDDNAPEGNVVYYVEVYAGDEASDRINLSAYIGPEEPQQPADVTLTHNGTTATLTWTAPTKGIHDITLDQSMLTYDVTRVLDGQETAVATALTATTFSEDITSDNLTALSYKVLVKYGTKPASAASASNSIKLGIINLPFDDSFADSEGNPAFNPCWSVEQVATPGYTQYAWTATSRGSYPAIEPQDGDGALAYYNSYNASSGSSCRLYTAAINASGITNGVLSFWYYKRSGGTDGMKVQYSRDGGEWTDFTGGEISAALENGETTGWRNYTFSLAEAVEGASDNIRVAFTSVSAYGTGIGVDNVQIYNLEGHDLSADGISIPDKVVSGNEVELSFTISNKGAADVSASDYSINIITGYPGAITLPATVDIASLQNHTFTLTIPFTAAEAKDVESYTFQAEVIYADDDNTDNNLSAEASIAPGFIVDDQRPGTTDLRYAIQSDKSVELTWKCLKDPEAHFLSMKESFEDLADGTTDNLNGWIIVDKDNMAISGEYPAAASSKLSVATVDTKPADADGSKVLGVNYHGNQWGDSQDDWIISPALTMDAANKAELSFLLGVKETSSSYYYYGYEVYWTESDIDPADPTALFTSSQRIAYKSNISTSTYSDFYGEKMVRVTVPGIPGSARHIAIRLTNDKYNQDMAMWLDDITIDEINAINVLGYNVYEEGAGRLNDELIPATTGSFTAPAAVAAEARATTSSDNLSAPGAPLIPVRRFFVTAVYNEGEATPSNTVETPSAIDLTLSGLTAPATVDAGERFDITVKITNNGNIAVRGHNVDYSVQLYCNGQESVQTDYDCPDLAPGESAEITFRKEPLTVLDPDSRKYHAGIHLIGEKEDYNPADNTTPQVTVTMNPVTLEAPADLTATHNDEGLLLTWRAPFITLPGDAGLLLEGYNIYRHEQKIATEETPWPYNAWTQTETLPDGTYTYKVTAVYNTGESAPCEPLEITVSALDIALAGDITVAAANSHITVTGADNMEVRVFNPAGALLFSGDAETLRRHTFTPGSYIVAVAVRSFKVQLR